MPRGYRGALPTHGRRGAARVERHQLGGRPSTEAGIEQAFGERLFGALRTQTAQLYLHIRSTVDSLEATLKALHTAAKSLYPGHPLMLMERPKDITHSLTTSELWPHS